MDVPGALLLAGKQLLDANFAGGERERVMTNT